MFYLFLLFLIIHLLFVAVKVIPILTWKLRPVPHQNIPFSIVIAARNEGNHLKTLIPELMQQEYPSYEVMVVLDRCQDHSREVVHSFMSTNPNLRVLEISKKPAGIDGKKHALECGIHAAAHEWILFTDADCRPVSSRWIQAFSEQVESQTEILLGVSGYDWHPGLLNACIQFETFQTAMHYIGSAISGNPYMGVGRNLAYRKSLFKKAGGFKEFRTLTGGDDDLFVQKNANISNTRVVLRTESLTYSAAKRTWKAYFMQKTRHLSVGKHYGSKLKIIHSIRSAVHLLVWLSFLYLVINGPFDTLVLGIFSTVIVVEGLMFTSTASIMGLSFSVLWYPIVDLLYAVMLPVMGIRSAFVKRVKWK